MSDKSTIKTLFSRHRKFLWLLFCITLVYGVSFYFHQSSYQYWMSHSKAYVVDDVVAMSGYDPYYWLKMARELDAGTIGIGRPEPTKAYPDGQRLAIDDTPSLLAEMISLARNFTEDNYYRAGLLLIPLLAGLFVLPLFFYFQRLGFAEAAIFGGLLTLFSPAYYDRVKMGRVDTDLLNVFFPLAISAFILPLNRERSWPANLGLAAAAGLMMQLFVRWYQQPSFIAGYAVVLLFYALLQRLPWRQILATTGVFLLCSGPGYVLEVFHSLQVFANAYIAPPPTGLIAWPNVLGVVTEAKGRGVLATLKLVHPFLPLIAIGCLGLAYLCLRYFRKMIPLAPLLALGGWSLVGPNRFAMYLAPLVAVGIGVVVQLAAQQLWRRLRFSELAASLATLMVLLGLFASATAYSGFPPPPKPAFTAETTRSLLEIKQRVPQHAAMFTPFWELGYGLMEIGDFATYHDGGLQGGMRTTLAAQAALAPDQGDMVSLLSYLEDHGFNQLAAKIRKDQLTSAQLLELVFDYPRPFSGEHVYVLYLEPMLWKTEGLSRFGTWDFDVRRSEPVHYYDIQCLTLEKAMLRCREGTVDLEQGRMNNGQADIAFKQALFVNNGYVVKQIDYPRDSEYYLQVLMNKGEIFRVLVAGKRLFFSNFNQQYLLGRYDRRYFREVYNDFPRVRLLQVKQGSTAQPGPVADE